jgi:diaminopimelate decarboxylase
MDGFNFKNNILHVDDIALPDLAVLAGTPTYIYSARQIRRNIESLQFALQKHLPPHQQPLICYACKANSHQAILTICNSSGLGADVVSGGELKRALKAQIPADKIVFSGVGKTREEIELALKGPIRQINVESESELRLIENIADKPIRIALRLNPNVDAKTHAKITTGKEDNKFGMPADKIMALFQKYKDHPFVQLRGISLHIGSQLTQLEPYQLAFQKLAEFVKDLRTQGLQVDSLDLGGGLGIVYQNEEAPSLDTYASLIKDIIAPLETAIILEPGRMIVGNAGVLLTRALYVKNTDARRYLILDAGMNDLMRPAIYEAWHGIEPVLKNPQAEITPYDIVGPVCETGDTFAKHRFIPQVEENELIAIMTAGAYGASMSSEYNTRARPAEILVDGNKVALISTRIEIEDIIAHDLVPQWLEGKTA